MESLAKCEEKDGMASSTGTQPLLTRAAVAIAASTTKLMR